MAWSLLEKQFGKHVYDTRRDLAGAPNGWGIATDGLPDAVTALQLLQDRAADLSGTWPEVGRWFADRQRQVFAGGNRDRWAPRSSSYIRRLRRDGLAGGGLLVRTGALRRAAASGVPLRSTARYAVFGIPPGPNRQKAQWLRKGRRSMPRRSAVPLLVAAEKRDLARTVREELLKGVAQ